MEFRDTVVKILQKQQELQHRPLELQLANSRLLTLVDWDSVIKDKRAVAGPVGPTLPNCRNANRHRNNKSSYFFRVHNVHDCKNTPGHVYTQDFHLRHLGFRGCYGIGETWDSVEIGLYLCFFGTDGPPSSLEAEKRI